MSPQADTAIIIAAFNAETTLDRAVRSALAQPQALEICIVDDASTDGSGALARAWAAREPRVKALSVSVNAGPASARNAAIEATTAPWITILDADDYMLEGRLGRLLALASEADFVADALIRVVGDAAAAPAAETLAPQALSFESFIRGNMGALHGGPLDLGYIKPLFRRAFVQQHGLRYRPDMRLGEDYELYARALALGARFLVTGAAGYVSVERQGSLSKVHSETDLQRLRDCDDGLRTIRPLAATERRALARHWTGVDNRLQWRRLISAVKARDLSAALGTFHTLASVRYLLVRLGEQVWLRGLAALRGPREDRLEMRQDRV